MKLGKYFTTTAIAGAIGYMAPHLPKQWNTPIEPMKDRIVSKVADTIKHKDILVIDGFNKNIINLDKNGRGDISHGRITSGIIEKGLPNANVYKRNIKQSDMENIDSMQTNIVKPLLKDMRNGVKYDAINLSIGTEMSFGELSARMGKDINPQNILYKSGEVKEYLRENAQEMGGVTESAMALVDCMDSISAKGTDIYVSAGNGGAGSFNFLSLIDDAINVGSIRKDGIVKKYSEDNSLINRWIDDTLPLETTKNGYSIDTGNGTIDVDKSACSGLFHMRVNKNLHGTSFASPKALVEDLK